jgi:hypothetical protein
LFLYFLSPDIEAILAQYPGSLDRPRGSLRLYPTGLFVGKFGVRNVLHVFMGMSLFVMLKAIYGKENTTYLHWRDFLPTLPFENSGKQSKGPGKAP